MPAGSFFARPPSESPLRALDCGSMRLHAERLYVRAPNWVGDLVMATPILQALREGFPKARITLSLRPHLEAVVRGATYFDELHFHPAGLGFSGLRKLAKGLTQRSFDAAILFPHSFETAFVAALARIPRRFGYAVNGRGFLLTDAILPPRHRRRRVPSPMPYHWTDLVGLAGVEVRSLRPRLAVDAATVASVDAWLDGLGIAPDQPFALLAPGASFGSSKLWRTDRFAEVADRLHDAHGLRSLVQFGPGEESLAREIVASARRGAVLADAPPLDLHRLKAAAARAALVVCTDSGVRHYGVAFDKPVVCVMGPNDPRYTAANLERTAVVRIDVECGPCQLKVCPLDHRCMEGIAAEAVAAAAHRLLVP